MTTRRVLSVVLILIVAAAAAAYDAVIPSGSTTKTVSFHTVQSSDHVSDFTGGTTFTVYYSIEGGTPTAMTTPTVTELDSTNMPGWYKVLIDEPLMTVVPAGQDVATLDLHVTHASMDAKAVKVGVAEPLSDIALITGGRTVAAAESNIRGGSQTLASVDAKIDIMDGVADNIKAKTDLIPASPAAVGSEMTLTAAYDAAKTAAQPGADGDTLKTLSDQLDGVVSGALTEAEMIKSLRMNIMEAAIDADPNTDSMWDIGKRLGVLEAKFTSMIESDGSTGWEYTGPSLINAPTGTGSGLTAQETRDAMLLAPSAGSPAAGSLDALLADLLLDTGTTLPDQIDALNDLSSADAQAAAAAALTAYDVPTEAQMNARTKVAADYFDPATDGVTVTTNSDKTGYALAADQAVNVTKINGTSIAGTGSQVAAAFEHFFDVATPAKTINDVGVSGSGLSQQDVRDALKLAPSAGDPAAGSIDAQVAATNNTLGAAGAGLTSLGDARLANLDAAVSSRSSHTAADVKTAMETNGGKLDAVYDKLPSKSYLAGTANADGDVQMDEATGNFPGTVAKSPATLAAADVSGNVPADVKAYTTQPTVTGATLSAAYDPAKTAASAADVLAALGTYDVPTLAEMEARTLLAANYFDPATDAITVDVDEAAIATALLATQIDGVTLRSLFEAQLADLTGKVAVTISGTTRTYTYYKQDGVTVKLIIQATTPTGARTTTGQIDPE